MKSILSFILLLTVISTTVSVQAEIERETYGQFTLDELPERTLLVNTFSSRTLVYDTDNLTLLGMLSLGIGANAVEVDRPNDRIYVAENYFSRHTRGERTDVVSGYTISTLSPASEIVIPPKHASGSPMRHYSGVITDGETRLMLVVNITPAVSLSVVDLDNQKFLTEISTAGCGLIYPVEGLRFLQLCGDGTTQLITLNADGSEAARTRSESFFNLEADPLMEKGVKTKDGQWLFNTFKGKFFSINSAGDSPVATEVFDLTSLEEGWYVGGMQPLAYHADTDLLLVLVNEDDGSNEPFHIAHKEPGEEIWYVDLKQKRLRHRLEMTSPISAIQVSQDKAPLLYAASVIDNQIAVYDLMTTTLRGIIEEAGMPTLLQNL